MTMRLLLLVLVCLASHVYVLGQNCGRSRRRPWRSLSCAEQRQFLQACQDLKASGRWDELVLNHQRSGDWGHLVPAFLPWHRWLIWMAERELQRISGSCLTIPYWDWERTGGIESALRPDGFGTNTGRGCVRDGIAQDWTVVENGGCLQRAFDDRWRISRDVEVISRITNNRDFARFRVELEGAPHTNTHEWVGGAMADRWAVDDPIFFIHHCNVDRIYTLWQNYWGHPSMDLDQLGGEHYDANLNSELVFRWVRQLDWDSPRTGNPPTIRELMMVNGPGAIMNYGYESDQLAQMLVQSSNRFAQEINTNWNNPGRVSSANACAGAIFGGNPFPGNTGGGGQGGGRPPQGGGGPPGQGCSMGVCPPQGGGGGGGGGNPNQGGGNPNQGGGNPNQGGGNPPNQGVCRQRFRTCNRNRDCCNQRCRRANDGRMRCMPRRGMRGLQFDDNDKEQQQYEQQWLEEERFEEDERWHEREARWEQEANEIQEELDQQVDQHGEPLFMHQVPDFGYQQDRWYELMAMFTPQYPEIIFETLAREDCEARQEQGWIPATPEWLATSGFANSTETLQCHSIMRAAQPLQQTQQQHQRPHNP